MELSWSKAEVVAFRLNDRCRTEEVLNSSLGNLDLVSGPLLRLQRSKNQTSPLRGAVMQHSLLQRPISMGTTLGNLTQPQKDPSLHNTLCFRTSSITHLQYYDSPMLYRMKEADLPLLLLLISSYQILRSTDNAEVPTSAT